MRTLLAVLALVTAALAAPSIALADCDPTGAVCATESESVVGSCAAGDGFESHATAVTVAAGLASASAQGANECYESGSYAYGTGGIVVAAGAGPAGVGAQWTEFHYSDPKFGDFQGCFIALNAPAYVYEACPAALSPPNPGWGHLLP